MNTFVVANPNKCIGCRTCEVACAVAHSETNIFTQGMEEVDFNPRLTVTKTAAVSAPIQCRHCEDAPCANICPKRAITNRDGVIYIDKSSCVGCKACAVACPFGAINIVKEYNKGEKVLQNGLKINEQKNVRFKQKMVASKCDLCIGREGGPACVEICPTKALKVIEAKEIEKSVEGKRSQVAVELMNVMK
ncbi:4Fe-4S dicluster domain-containing protein [Clostridium botulinum]|nr:4Fe-4S dicluster domain-containing protein [Clostridium botulinum]